MADKEQPADKPPMGEDVWEKREMNRAQDIRSQALSLAVSKEHASYVELFDVAEDFAAYITDGTKP